MTDDLTATYYLGGFARAAERVAVQARCSFDEATDLMIERADTERCSLGDLAIAVVEGRIRFDN
ncbi:MAG: hypothetical protein JWM72_585 [Actinomycetia bacterium]|nr:hypothetical protein [Actinomycetes bacterium]MDQ1462283.1 hypothetical protein [Actinomycetota bacterium]